MSYLCFVRKPEPEHIAHAASLSEEEVISSDFYMECNLSTIKFVHQPASTIFTNSQTGSIFHWFVAGC